MIRSCVTSDNFERGEISVSGLSKSFRGKLVFDGVSFVVRVGELVLLVGPNGSGKTTLLRIIAGLLQPDTGKVFLGDRSTGKALSFGYVPQSVQRIHYLSGEDFLCLAGGLYGLEGREIEERIAELKKALCLKELKTLVDFSSSGMAKLLMLAAALLHRPRLLLLDEPLDSLDPSSRAKVIAYLHAGVERREVGVLLATHRPKEYAEIGTRVVNLDN